MSYLDTIGSIEIGVTEIGGSVSNAAPPITSFECVVTVVAYGRPGIAPPTRPYQPPLAQAPPSLGW